MNPTNTIISTPANNYSFPLRKIAKCVAIFLGVAGAGGLIVGTLAFSAHQGWITLTLLKSAIGFKGSIIFMAVGTGSLGIGIIVGVVVIRSETPSRTYEKEWEECILLSTEGDTEQKKKFIEKMKHKCPPDKIFLFFNARDGESDLIFGNQGTFDSRYERIMKENKNVVLFICPQDEGSSKRWNGPSNCFESLANHPDQRGKLMPFKNKPGTKIVILQDTESYELKSFFYSDGDLPKKIKKQM